jgi:hypothetical protein
VLNCFRYIRCDALKSRGLYNLIQSLDSDQEGNISVFWGNPKLDNVEDLSA